MNPFQKASRSQVFLKLAITGPTGSGKTFSALRLLLGMLDITPGNYLLPETKKIAFGDTENKSASLYAPPEGIEPNFKTTFPFDVVDIEPPFEHEKFISLIHAAVAEGYGALVLDSSSHFWEGILEYKSKLDSRPGTNSYTNWNEAGKKFQGIIDALLQSKIHIICCMRSKMDYIIETNEKGKQAPKKVGLAPIMRDGISYEFTTVFDVALNHEAEVSKDRSQLFTDKIFQITEATGKEIAAWLKTATPKSEPVATATVELTEEEAHAKNVDALRKVIVKNCNNEDAENYEALFCGKAAALCEDNRDRMKLEQFTLSELRGPVWKGRAAVLSMIHATIGNGKA